MGLTGLERYLLKLSKVEYHLGVELMFDVFMKLEILKNRVFDKETNSIEENDTRLQCLTLLYALFDKFGDSISKNRFKEVFSVTEIGKMIRDDGKSEGKAEILIKLLNKKFKKFSQEYEEKIKNLPSEKIELIANDIFDLEKAEDLEKYF